MLETIRGGQEGMTRRPDRVVGEVDTVYLLAENRLAYLWSRLRS